MLEVIRKCKNYTHNQRRKIDEKHKFSDRRTNMDYEILNFNELSLQVIVLAILVFALTM